MFYLLVFLESFLKVIALTPAVLNLGFAYPWGYASNSQGESKKLETAKKYLIWDGFHLGVRIGGTQKGTIVICTKKVENPCLTLHSFGLGKV